MSNIENAESLKCEFCEVQCEPARKFVSLVRQKKAVESMGITILGADEERFKSLLEDVPDDTRREISLGVAKEAFARELDNLDQEIQMAREDIDSKNLACSGLLKAWEDHLA